MLVPQFLLQCGWSLRDRPRSHHWQGATGTRSIGDPDYGVPFGADHLVLLFLSHVLNRTGTRTVRGHISEIPQLFQVEWRRVTAISRLARVVCCCYVLPGRDVDVPTRRLLIADSIHIDNATGNYFLSLTREFADELADAAPLSIHIVRQLARSPGALVFYLWQAWHHHHGQGRDTPLSGPDSPYAMLNAPNSPDKMRQELRQRQRLINRAWPECPYVIRNNRLLYRPISQPACTAAI